MVTSKEIMELTSTYGANNYHPLPVVVSEAEGVWVKDTEGNKYGYAKRILSGESRASTS